MAIFVLVIQFNCSACGQALEIEDHGGGTTVGCPFCSADISVPTKAEQPLRIHPKESTKPKTPKMFYDDGTIRITDTEIRTQNFTIYVQAVTSVAVTTTKASNVNLMFSLIVLVGVVLPGFFLFSMLRKMLGNVISLPVLPLILAAIPIILMIAVAIVTSRQRVSEVRLQTSGGPVILFKSLDFGDSPKTRATLEKIKTAIEQARQGAR